MQFFYIIFLPKFVSVTRANFLTFFLCIFMGKKNFAQFLFVKFSHLEQFYCFTCAIDLYRFITKFIRRTCNFLSLFPLNFYRKVICTGFIFCKFSYLDQFYSFTRAILLFHFFHNVYPSHVQFSKFLSFVFLQKKIFVQFLSFVNLI